MKTIPVAVSLSLAVVLATGCAKQKQPVAGYEADVSQATAFFQGGVPRPGGAGAGDPAQVLITVNGKAITRGQLQLEAYRMASLSGLPPERLAQERENILKEAQKNLIVRAVLSQAADKEGVQIPSSDIAGQLEKIRTSIPEGSSLEAELKKQNLTLEQMADNIREGLKLEKIQTLHAGNPAPATPEEIAAFHQENLKALTRPETVTALHIVRGLKPGENDPARLKTLIDEMEALRKQAMDPRADFEALALTHTEQKGPDGKPKIKTTIARGTTPPDFEREIFKPEPGQVAEVLATQNQVHLLKVLEKAPAEIPTVEQAAPRIQEIIAARRKQAAVSAYVEGLLKEAKIETIQPAGQKETPAQEASGKPAGGEGAANGAP
jgi:peptidyl-prolyl cis-trans isomerase C